ncbi:hypothetical protein LTR78_006040 [Recurvomyces mirabilis]|uniref:Uncharacterized protein n=1 Tax=Recurvomyces mirabilis TaxID=574656 RepID=A0AAE0WM01_9PEZI|nr:hypothetical protein LTR78_006040 [Recurvomyces mirabilis]
MNEEPPDRLDITNVKLIASYNWLDCKEPTILVPDCRVDLITDRWAFSQLLGHFGKLREKGAAFGFQAQVIGNTVVFMSNDAGKAEVIGTNPRSFKGFRDNFGAEYLQYRADCAESVSHYGIVEYDLDGIKILLRHKVNGFLDEKAPEALIDLLSLEVAVPGELKDSKGDIIVRSAGCLVTQAAHLELSTAKSVNTVEKYLEKEMPEQWISQTPNFIRCSAGLSSSAQKRRHHACRSTRD